MTERYECVALTSDPKYIEEIKDFCIDREANVSCINDSVIGLESYLKRLALYDDMDGQVKIYLIRDRVLNEVAAYFGLKAGMVIDNENGAPSEIEKAEVLAEFNAKLVAEVTPGIEISHFAINDNYRRHVSTPDNLIKGLGEYFYPAFIYPIVEEVAQRIGVKLLYLYAANDANDKDERLIRYYENVFGFHMAGNDDFYIPLQPGYDGGCKFMYQVI